MIPEKLGHLGSDKAAGVGGQIESQRDVGQMRLGLVRTERAFRVGRFLMKARQHLESRLVTGGSSKKLANGPHLHHD